MTFVYLTEQGAVLKKTGRRLVVEKDDQKLLDIPAAKVEGVMIFGNVQFTTQAVQLLLRQGVELALFSRSGWLFGQLTDPNTKNIALRMAQFARHGQPAFVLELARTLVHAKLANCLTFMRQFGHNHPETQLAVEVDHLEGLCPRTAEAAELAALLGLEGSGARVYFQAFAKMVRHGFDFDGRRRRPATDPVNALLSLGCTILYNEISALLDGMGFDPYLVYYHQPRHGHATLASDLMEEFRTPLVDRLTLRIINNRTFQEADFYSHAPMIRVKPPSGNFAGDRQSGSSGLLSRAAHINPLLSGSRNGMLYTISHDIPDDKRRLKIAKILLDYGPRVQYSVFEAHLDVQALDQLRRRIKAEVEPTEDHVRIYPHCMASERGLYRNYLNLL